VRLPDAPQGGRPLPVWLDIQAGQQQHSYAIAASCLISRSSFANWLANLEG